MRVDESVLDSSEALARADPSSVLRALAGAGAQVRQAVVAAREALQREPAADRPRAVVVTGGGDTDGVARIVAALVADGGVVPVVRLPGPSLPPWVGALDLVIALSLDERWDSSAALAAEAARRGASLVAVSPTEGPLASVSLQARGLHVAVPDSLGGTALPRGSHVLLWSLLAPALCLAHELRLLGADASHRALLGTADALDDQAKACGPAVATFDNPAKSLALFLDGSVPLVAASGPLGDAAARRATSVLARVARIPSARAALPDDAGELVATFSGPFSGGGESDVFADPFDDPTPTRARLLLLDLAPDHRQQVVRDLAGQHGIRISEPAVSATTCLDRFAQSIAQVDFAAAYLALGSGLDPAPSLDAFRPG